MSNNICIAVLIGLPACGKSTFVQQLKQNFQEDYLVYHICYDDIIDIKDENINDIQWKELRQTILQNVDDLINLIKYHNISYFKTPLNVYQSRINHLLKNYCNDFCKVLSSIENMFSQSSILKSNLISNQSSEDGNNYKHLIIIDDNNYYKSMRYNYYKLAKKYEISYCQFYFEMNLEQSLKFNKQRRNEDVKCDNENELSETIQHRNSQSEDPLISHILGLPLLQGTPLEKSNVINEEVKCDNYTEVNRIHQAKKNENVDKWKVHIKNNHVIESQNPVNNTQYSEIHETLPLSTRNKNINVHCIPDEVIIEMHNKLEPPSSNEGFERDRSMTINAFKINFNQVKNFIDTMFTTPVKSPLDNTSDTKDVVLDENIIQKCDLILRNIVSKKMKTKIQQNPQPVSSLNNSLFSTMSTQRHTCTNMKQYSKHLANVKKQVLLDIQNGNIILNKLDICLEDYLNKVFDSMVSSFE